MKVMDNDNIGVFLFYIPNAYWSFLPSCYDAIVTGDTPEKIFSNYIVQSR